MKYRLKQKYRDTNHGVYIGPAREFELDQFFEPMETITQQSFYGRGVADRCVYDVVEHCGDLCVVVDNDLFENSKDGDDHSIKIYNYNKHSMLYISTNEEHHWYNGKIKPRPDKVAVAPALYAEQSKDKSAAPFISTVLYESETEAKEDLRYHQFICWPSKLSDFYIFDKEQS